MSKKTIPIRPFVRDAKGVVRFQENALVRLLLDESQKRGFGLTELLGHSSAHYSQKDAEEFYQLIGYSLAGYHELSDIISDEAAEAATTAARAQLGDAAIAGCRDMNCPIHRRGTKG